MYDYLSKQNFPLPKTLAVKSSVITEANAAGFLLRRLIGPRGHGSRELHVFLEAVTVPAASQATRDKIGDNLRPEDELRAAIVAGRPLPNERLVKADLTHQFDVGRAAVRPALARLEHEGLVELEPHRGARVRILAPGRSEHSLAEHTAIVDAVAARDPEAAETAICAHLSHIADALRSQEWEPTG